MKTTKYHVLKRLPPRMAPKPNVYLYFGKDVDKMTERQLRTAFKRLMDYAVRSYCGK